MAPVLGVGQDFVVRAVGTQPVEVAPPLDRAGVDDPILGHADGSPLGELRAPLPILAVVEHELDVEIGRSIETHPGQAASALRGLEQEVRLARRPTRADPHRQRGCEHLAVDPLATAVSPNQSNYRPHIIDRRRDSDPALIAGAVAGPLPRRTLQGGWVYDRYSTGPMVPTRGIAGRLAGRSRAGALLVRITPARIVAPPSSRKGVGRSPSSSQALSRPKTGTR